MCGKPPKSVSLFDLSIKTSSVDFPKHDFDELLKIADQALKKILAEIQEI